MVLSSSGDDSHLPFGTCRFGFASFNFTSLSTCSPHVLSIAFITFRKALCWRCIQLTESVTQLQFNGEIELMKWMLFSTRERQAWVHVYVCIFAVTMNFTARLECCQISMNYNEYFSLFRSLFFWLVSGGILPFMYHQNGKIRKIRRQAESTV